MLMKCQFFIILINLRWNFILKIYNYAMNLEILQNKNKNVVLGKMLSLGFTITRGL